MKKGAFLAVGAVVVVVLAFGSAPAVTTLHLKLDKSTPEADQILRQAPEKIVLEFSEKPELPVSRISLAADHGDPKLLEVARSEEDETVLWAAFEEPLSDGVYTVNWATSSADGHPIRGEFTFTVNASR